jgi:hypothetical protein
MKPIDVIYAHAALPCGHTAASFMFGPSHAILKLCTERVDIHRFATLTEVKQVMSLGSGNTMKAVLTDLWESDIG